MTVTISYTNTVEDGCIGMHTAKWSNYLLCEYNDPVVKYNDIRIAWHGIVIS